MVVVVNVDDAFSVLLLLLNMRAGLLNIIVRLFHRRRWLV